MDYTSQNGCFRFDLDLKLGQHFENTLFSILTSENDVKVEVKRDFLASETGNLAIEYKCRGKLSGLSVSLADWYAFFLGGDEYKDEVIVLIKTDRLKKIVKKVYNKNKQKIMGGDDNLSEMILIDVYQLLTTNIKK